MWCHHADRYEAKLDHPTPDGRLNSLRAFRSNPRQEIALAAQAAADLARRDTLQPWAVADSNFRPASRFDVRGRPRSPNRAEQSLTADVVTLVWGETGEPDQEQLLEELQEQGSGDQEPDQADARGDGVDGVLAGAVVVDRQRYG